MTIRFILLLSSAAALSGCSLFDGTLNKKSNSSYKTAQNSTYDTSKPKVISISQPRYYGSDLPVTGSGSTYSATNAGTYKSYGAYTGASDYAGAAVEIFPTGMQSSHSTASQNETHYVGSKTNAGSAIPALRGSKDIGFYGNLGAVMYDVSDEVFGVVARAGLERGILGAELEGSVGITNESETIGDMRVSGGIDHSLGIFGVARHAFTPKWSALGRVGYHSTRVNAKTRNVNGGASMSGSASFDGIAYGAGVEYNLDKVNGLRLDYTRYDYDDVATADSVSATYLRRF